jgi:Peptidase family M48
MMWLLLALSPCAPQEVVSTKSSGIVQSKLQSQQPTQDQIIDRVIEGESRLVQLLHNFKPVVETYVQNMQPDQELGLVPKNDAYFLGRLDFSRNLNDRPFLQQKRLPALLQKVKGAYTLQYSPEELSRLALLDEKLDRQRYTFSFRRRETLGEIRCLVFNVQPRDQSSGPRFLGRIWVEDQDYKIVRFNGTLVPHPRSRASLHFDSWRLNLLPKTWLPSFVYSEESDEEGRLGHKIRYRAQTRLWGYDLRHAGDHREYQQTLVNNPVFIPGGEPSQNLSPLLSERESPYSTEENIIERLQVAGLMAPDGDLDRVLEQVVTNLIITNDIKNLTDVRCRILLTTPFESFSFGHTIVVSRGLLDVLPNEVTLAAILAHELAHVLLGHSGANSFGFTDRAFIPDEKVLQRLNFHRDRAQEEAADAKALALLRRSPYKDDLSTAGLFFRMLKVRGPDLPNLIQSRLGTTWGDRDDARMQPLQGLAPKLEMNRTDQIAALPLGGRVKLDPWSDRVELVRPKPIALQNPREKLPLELTPFFPYLVRYQSDVAIGSGKSSQ